MLRRWICLTSGTLRRDNPGSFRNEVWDCYSLRLRVPFGRLRWRLPGRDASGRFTTFAPKTGRALFFEHTHLVTPRECATLAQKMNTLASRSRADQHADSLKSPLLSERKFHAPGGSGAKTACARAELHHQT
jgi:hypothetical protein